jgi:hypothetical protein
MATDAGWLAGNANDLNYKLSIDEKGAYSEERGRNANGSAYFLRDDAKFK